MRYLFCSCKLFSTAPNLNYFQNYRSHRRNRWRSNIFKVGAMLVIFRPFEIFRAVWIFIPGRTFGSEQQVPSRRGTLVQRYQLWHKLWLHFFWPTFWLHCILYRTYMGGEALLYVKHNIQCSQKVSQKVSQKKWPFSWAKPSCCLP